MKFKKYIYCIFIILTISPSANFASVYARSTLILGQTLQGSTLGIASKNLNFGVSTGLLGFTSAYVLSDNSMSNSTSLAINSASLWSDLYGYALGWVLFKDTSKRLVMMSLLGGLGTSTSAIFASKFTTSSGDLALINATTLWGTIVTLELAASLSPQPSGNAKYVVLFGLTSSMIGGYFAAQKNEFTPERSVKISLYGLLGAFSGAGFAWTMYFTTKRAYYISLLAGTLLGLYGGYLLTEEAKIKNSLPFSSASNFNSLTSTKISLGKLRW